MGSRSRVIVCCCRRSLADSDPIKGKVLHILLLQVSSGGWELLQQLKRQWWSPERLWLLQLLSHTVPTSFSHLSAARFNTGSLKSKVKHLKHFIVLAPPGDGEEHTCTSVPRPAHCHHCVFVAGSASHDPPIMCLGWVTAVRLSREWLIQETTHTKFLIHHQRDRLVVDLIELTPSEVLSCYGWYTQLINTLKF